MKKIMSVVCIAMIFAVTLMMTSCDEPKAFVKSDFATCVYIGISDDGRAVLENEAAILEIDVPNWFWERYKPGDSICPIINKYNEPVILTSN